MAPGTLIFVDGLLLGAARYRTKSVYVPIAMHLLWNLYAIW
jgi:CAAX amino terminal protease family.